MVTFFLIWCLLFFVDYEVRVGEVGDKKKKMKLFASTLLDDNLGRFSDLIKVADTCRVKLFEQKKGTLEAFRVEK